MMKRNCWHKNKKNRWVWILSDLQDVEVPIIIYNPITFQLHLLEQKSIHPSSSIIFLPLNVTTNPNHPIFTEIPSFSPPKKKQNPRPPASWDSMRPKSRNLKVQHQPTCIESIESHRLIQRPCFAPADWCFEPPQLRRKLAIIWPILAKSVNKKCSGRCWKGSLRLFFDRATMRISFCHFHIFLDRKPWWIFNFLDDFWEKGASK